MVSTAPSSDHISSLKSLGRTDNPQHSEKFRKSWGSCCLIGRDGSYRCCVAFHVLAFTISFRTLLISWPICSPVICSNRLWYTAEALFPLKKLIKKREYIGLRIKWMFPQLKDGKLKYNSKEKPFISSTTQETLVIFKQHWSIVVFLHSLGSNFPSVLKTQSNYWVLETCG